MSERPDSYSRVERLWLEPGRRLLGVSLAPVVALLARFPLVSPNVVSASQLLLASAYLWALQERPAVAFVLFLLSVLVDGLDGALARRTGRVTEFGSFFDQLCDHARETVIVAGLAWVGALSPLLAVLYPMVYGGFNLVLYLCNRFHSPLPLAIKSYMVVYPAIFLYLVLRVNWLDYAVLLSEVLMVAVILQGLARLRYVMDKDVPRKEHGEPQEQHGPPGE